MKTSASGGKGGGALYRFAGVANGGRSKRQLGGGLDVAREKEMKRKGQGRKASLFILEREKKRISNCRGGKDSN